MHKLGLLLPLVLLRVSFVASQVVELEVTESSPTEDIESTNISDPSSEVFTVNLSDANVRLREQDEEEGKSKCMELIGGYQKNLLYPEEFTDEQVIAQVAGTHIGYQLKPFYWYPSDQYNG